VFSPSAEAFLYDFAGRVVARVELPEKKQGTVVADFSRSLPDGIYFLYLKSADGAASVGITFIR